MKMVQVTNLTHSVVEPILAIYCDTFLCKLRGYICRQPLQLNQGLMLVSSRESRIDSAIHMIGVPTDLTIVWIDHDITVVDVQLARRNHLAYFPASPAQYVLELHPERMRDFFLKDQLRCTEIVNDQLDKNG